MTKTKFKDRYSEIGIKKEYHTKIEGESLTNIANFEDTDLKLMARRYGLKSILPRTEITEEMYGWDLTDSSLSLGDRLEIKERMKNYFYEQPAIIRKDFNDSFSEFYESYLIGKNDKFYKHGILKEKGVNNEKILDTNIKTDTENNSEINNTNTN